jgi:hypothetical protein
MTEYKTIAESNNFIVLDKYSKDDKVTKNYQSEDELEREFIRDLQNQGYEYVPGLNTPEKMLGNVRCRTSLLKLLNHLHLIACNSFLIQQVDVFDMAIIKNKIKDIYNCFRRLKEHRQMFQIEDRQITKIGELFHI